MYCITRKDLSYPQRAVQSSHALLNATRDGLIPSDIEHPHLIICELPSEEKLHQFMHTLEIAGIRHSTFREPDRGNELTAIACEPISGEKRSIFRKLQLLRIHSEDRLSVAA